MKHPEYNQTPLALEWAFLPYNIINIFQLFMLTFYVLSINYPQKNWTKYLLTIPFTNSTLTDKTIISVNTYTRFQIFYSCTDNTVVLQTFTSPVLWILPRKYFFSLLMWVPMLVLVQMSDHSSTLTNNEVTNCMNYKLC